VIEERTTMGGRGERSNKCEQATNAKGDQKEGQLGYVMGPGKELQIIEYFLLTQYSE
jgi:hypothetical protein